MTIIEYLSKKGIKILGNGQEKRTDCLFCDDKGGHLHINVSKDVFYCVKCNSAGNIYRLKKHFGELEVFKPTIGQYKRPKQSLLESLKLTPEALEFLTRVRGLSPEIIKDFKLGCDGQFISIPYYKDHELVNIKYRSINGKEFKREKDTESTLYNMDSIDKTQDIYVVEGEFDCMAAVQLGLKNCVSVANGAGAFDSSWVDWFDSCIGRVFLCYDNDSDGEKGAEKASDKIGKHKCYRVTLPLKDFNDCLMAGYTKEQLSEYIDKAKPFTMPNLRHASDIAERLYDELFGEANKEQRVHLKNLSKLTDLLAGLRRSEITIITGDTASGKTTFGLNMIYELLMQNKRALIASTEMKTTQVLSKMVSMHTEKPTINISKEEYNNAIFEICKECLFFIDVHGYLDIEKIKDYLRYCRRKYDIEYVLLDHLHFFVKSSDDSVKDIENFMRELVGIALELNISVFLIVHPSKLDNDIGRVTMNNLKGSSAIKQDSHNIVSIWRNKEKELAGVNEVVCSVEKVRDDNGRIGKIKFVFNQSSQSYTEEKNDKRVEESKVQKVPKTWLNDKREDYLAGY